MNKVDQEMRRIYQSYNDLSFIMSENNWFGPNKSFLEDTMHVNKNKNGWLCPF